MQVASTTRQVVFLCHDDHAIGLVYGSGYSLLVKRGERAQINHFDSAAIAVDTIGGSRTRLQHHRTPANNSDAGWSIADTHASALAYGQRVISFGDVPVLCHGRYTVALIFFGRVLAIKMPALLDNDGVLLASSFKHHTLDITQGAHANRYSTGFST